MPAPKSNLLRNRQHERRKQVCEWLVAHDGWHTAGAIGSGIGLDREHIINTVEWLERKELLIKQVNTTPYKRIYYRLAMSLEEAMLELDNELEEADKRMKTDSFLDPEHLAWMTKYRKKFVERYRMMNLAIPEFSTES